MRLLLAILLAFYPYALSLGASDLDLGTTTTATISAPAGASVELRAPDWLAVGPVVYQGGDTWQARLTVRGDNAYGRVELWVDGVLRASQGVRVGTPGVRVWLPLVAQRKAPIST